MRRPNILLLTSDQHRGDCFGFEGRRVHTPHLDLLARQGTRFSTCITPNVVCMPARASMLTGLLPLTHGTADNGIDLDPGIAEQGFAGTLGRNGFETAFIGKAHFSSNHSARPTGRCENLASSHRFADGWHGPYMGFDHVELMQLGHNYWLPEHPPGGMHYERWYHGDGLGELKNALYRQHMGPPVSAAQTHASALPPLGTTAAGSATVRSSTCAPGDGGADRAKADRSVPGSRLPIRIIRSTRQCHGAHCTGRRTSTSPCIARGTSTVARGGIAPLSRVRRRAPTGKYAKSTRACRSKTTASYAN